VTEPRAVVNGERAVDIDATRSLSVPMDVFAWEAIEEESARLGVSVEELVAFSVLYYLADVDSGRVARQIGLSPYLDLPPADFPPQPRVSR
jgi:hypothetical protein